MTLAVTHDFLMKKERKRKGIFVVIEGIDGAGKTTVINELKKMLRNEKVFFTKEPSQGFIGKMIRSALRGHNFTQEAWCLLFFADRIEHCKAIKKKLEEGYIVISERYFFSTLAYQSTTINMRKLLGFLTSYLLETEKILMPDLVFLLDVDVNTAIKRLKESREHFDIFEEAENLKRVREEYLKLSMIFKMNILDSTYKDPKALAEEITKEIESYKEKYRVD
jgi:dTMP kinase